MRRRTWSIAGAAVAVLVAAAVACAWLLLAGSRPRLDGDLRLPGLAHPVQVERDAAGMVTLTGADRDDLTYALGFVHAQERFFEMDLMRRSAAGELAALVGPAALDLDLEVRPHRLRAVARAAYDALPAARRRVLQRYSAGVNAGLAALRVRPWAYLLLRTRPQRWRPEDTLLVIGAMYLDLNQHGRNRRELDIARLRAALPRRVADFLLAPAPDWEAPLAGRLSPSPAVPGPSVLDLRADAPARGAPIAETTARHPGSNSFAVGGRLTAGGAAMLANDMHLGLRVPNIWFRARLRYPDPDAPDGRRDAVGVTLPGTPALVVGSNGQVAWGFTNSYGDWADWVRIERDPKDPSRYRVPGGWAPFERHQERIAVKGGADRTLAVESTRYGPLLAKDTDGTPLALAWIGQRPRAYNLGLMALEHAGSAQEALAMAPHFGMPPQNLLVADRAGHIGWTLAGDAIPLRRGFDPQVPADWSTPGTGWTGWAPASDYPRIYDPPGARLWTANNRTVGGDALVLLGNGGHDLGARAQQIRDDLWAHAAFTPGTLLDIQLDDRAVFLTRWQRLLQRTLPGSTDPALVAMRRLTRPWRNRADPASVDYRLVRAFRQRVHRAVLAPFVARVRARFPDFAWPRGSDPEAAVWALLQTRPAWLLDRRYPDWHALLVQAAREVAKELGGQPGGLAARRWGEINRAAIDHPLARALPGPLARALDMPADPLPGDVDMPRVAAPAFGASERLDVAPGHEDRGILEMPGGQADNPLAPYYGAGHEDWVHGRPTPLLPGPTRYRLTLRP